MQPSFDEIRSRDTQQRHAHEKMTEEELVIFDTRTRHEPESSASERTEVRPVIPTYPQGCLRSRSGLVTRTVGVFPPGGIEQHAVNAVVI